MPTNNEQLLRRQFLRTGLISGLALLTGVSVSAGKGVRSAKPENNPQFGINVLIQALRSTGNAVCLGAADRLEGFRTSSAYYDLHLRNAGLGAVEAEIIAQAMRKLSLYEAPTLRSFSMSYNPGLTNAGVVLLAKALPATLIELGLVDCAIGDKGGMALLHWAKKSVALRMICVEGNLFSPKIREEFASLASEKRNLLVVV